MPMPEIDPSRIPEYFRPFAAKLMCRSDAAVAFASMLRALGPKAKRRDSAKMALLLREAFPASSLMTEVTNPFVRNRYAVWYIEAVNDEHRNRAYRMALEAVVRPGAVVLEIGTGSGLFTMFAVRAGAKHVYSFESRSRLVAIARENIRRNGLSDRITLIRKDFKDAKIGEDLPVPADVLMHEFSSAQSLPRIGKQLIRVCAEVLRPGAPVLPERFELRAAISGDETLARSLRVSGPVSGIDVDAINLLAVASVDLPRGVPMEAPLSAPFTAASFEPMKGDKLAKAKTRLDVTATADGTAFGVVRWIAQRFPGGAVYENTPGLHCNWQPYFTPFSEPMEVKTGDRVALDVTTLNNVAYIEAVRDSSMSMR